MRNDEGMTSSDRELEAALAGLAPTRPGIDRDRLMFCAGRASLRRRNHLWQGVSSAQATLLLASVLTRPVLTDGGSAPEASGLPVADVSPRSLAPVDQERIEAFRHYVRTRRAVLDRGIEAIPASSGRKSDGAAPPLTGEDLDELLS